MPRPSYRFLDSSWHVVASVDTVASVMKALVWFVRVTIVWMTSVQPRPAAAVEMASVQFGRGVVVVMVVLQGLWVGWFKPVKSLGLKILNGPLSPRPNLVNEKDIVFRLIGVMLPVPALLDAQQLVQTSL